MWPCVWWRALFPLSSAWSRAQGRCSRRFRGLVRKDISLVAANTASSVARGLAPPPIAPCGIICSNILRGGLIHGQLSSPCLVPRPPTSSLPQRAPRPPPRRCASRPSVRPPPAEANILSGESHVASHGQGISPRPRSLVIRNTINICAW